MTSSLAEIPISDPTPKADIASLAAMRLVAAVQALSHARNLDSIIEVVRKAARELTDSDGASFILRDGDQCHYVDEDAIAPLWKGQRFPAAICVSGWSMINHRAAIIKDIYDDARIPIEAYRPTFVRSMVMVPIRTDDPLGAIGIYWARQHAADHAEVELLEALANTTAVAMENVKLYDELEQRVVERTRQLEDANRELESFSYSVSHDLQAPLRQIDAYASLLADIANRPTPENSRRYLERIQTSAQRMGSLIGDLMRLARFGQQEIHCRKLDLSQLAGEVAASLRAEASHTVEFHVAPGMEICADPALMRIILENLLGNAWKFTSKSEGARVECGIKAGEGEAVTYFVKDNGPGFDMAYADKLFSPFQRLHTEKEFPGSGIGLATVQRIISRHGGRVWAESSLGKGACFFFIIKVP